MNLDLTNEETAALLRELDNIIDKRPLPALAPHPDPEGDPREAQAGAAPRARTAPEALRTTARGQTAVGARASHRLKFRKHGP
jgi:hypothetical protein